MEEPRAVVLRCPLCEKEGKGSCSVPAEFVWVPNVEDVKRLGKAYAALIETTGDGHERGRGLCGPHGNLVRKAGVKTYQLSQILERRQKKALSTLADLLGAEESAEITEKVVKADARRAKRTSKKADEKKKKEQTD